MISGDMVKKIKELNEDNSLILMPHPKRLKIPLVTQLSSLSSNGFDDELAEVFRRSKATPSNQALILSAMPDFESRLHNLPGMVTMRHGEQQAASSTFVHQQFYNANNGTVYTLDKGLLQVLLDSRIKEDIPCWMVRAPEPSAYIEFGDAETRCDPPEVNVMIESDLTQTEGFYVNEEIVPPGELNQLVYASNNLDPDKATRVLYFGFMESPQQAQHGKEFRQSVLNDMRTYFTIHIQDEMKGVLSVLKEQISVRRSKGFVVSQHNQMTDEKHDEHSSNILSLLELASKILLYINMPDVRQTRLTPEDELHKKLAGLKNASKKRKIENRYKGQYNRIVIGPKIKNAVSIASINDQLTSAAAPGKKAPHVRKGFFGIRYAGPQRSEPRITYVRPTIVNEDLIEPGMRDIIRKQYSIV